jgi:hypothetical protein
LILYVCIGNIIEGTCRSYDNIPKVPKNPFECFESKREQLESLIRSFVSYKTHGSVCILKLFDNVMVVETSIGFDRE